jgi:hypothetical protein
MLFCLLAVSAPAQQPDPLGTVTAQLMGCPSGGLVGTACYVLGVTCPAIPDYDVYLKTVAPTNPPKGVVTLIPGATSTDLWENFFTYGPVTVQNLVDDQFLVVEVTFGSPFNETEKGWQTNVAGAGVRAASCRYATVTAWIKNSLAPQVPLCAAGVSAGSQQIAEGLAHYGLDRYLAFAELASGPPFNRTDKACILSEGVRAVAYCSGADTGMGVGFTNAESYVDPAYPGPWCSRDIETAEDLHQADFLADSVTSPGALLSYPATNVKFLYGGLDDSAAINQGENYRLQITTPTQAGCVPDAPHPIPDVLSGAEQIASDMALECTLPKPKH